MDKGKKNNRLPINHDQFHYGCKKPLDNYSLSEGANDYLINEVNYVIEKLLLDGKKIAKENNDKTVIRSYLEIASNNIFKKKKSKLPVISGILGGILISTIFTFVPQIIDKDFSSESIVYILCSTLIGSSMLTYSFLKK